MTDKYLRRKARWKAYKLFSKKSFYVHRFGYWGEQYWIKKGVR